MYNKNFADINDQFIGLGKVLPSRESIQQWFMTLGKLWSQEKSVELLAVMLLWGVTIPICSALSARPGDVGEIG